MKFRIFIISGCILIFSIILLFKLKTKNRNDEVLNDNSVYTKTQAILATFGSSQALHPYLGFVLDHGADKDINRLGFTGPDMPIEKKEDDFNVGVFGGSVAGNFYEFEQNNLTKKISGLNPNKNVHIYSFAIAGYKQPQQLMALQYLLVLGYKFDLIINIDGFNEAALSYSENYQNKVSSFFPRSWNLYSTQSFDKKSVDIIDFLGNLKSLRNFFSGLPFQLGYIPNIIINNMYYKSQTNLNKRLAEINKTYQTQGPELTTNITDESAKQNIINTWSNSAIQMSRLAKINNIQYLEFLQPNQYVPHSKVFTPEELDKYININSPYAYPATEIYPQMIEKVQELKSEGVPIYNLADLFKNESKTLYIDDCCHYNETGYSLILKGILNSIDKTSIK